MKTEIMNEQVDWRKIFGGRFRLYFSCWLDGVESMKTFLPDLTAQKMSCHSRQMISRINKVLAACSAECHPRLSLPGETTHFRTSNLWAWSYFNFFALRSLLRRGFDRLSPFCLRCFYFYFQWTEVIIHLRFFSRKWARLTSCLFWYLTPMNGLLGKEIWDHLFHILLFFFFFGVGCALILMAVLVFRTVFHYSELSRCRCFELLPEFISSEERKQRFRQLLHSISLNHLKILRFYNWAYFLFVGESGTDQHVLFAWASQNKCRPLWFLGLKCESFPWILCWFFLDIRP